MEKIQRMNEVEEQILRMEAIMSLINIDLDKCKKHRLECRDYMPWTLARIRRNLIRLEKLGFEFRKSSIGYGKVKNG